MVVSYIPACIAACLLSCGSFEPGVRAVAFELAPVVPKWKIAGFDETAPRTSAGTVEATVGAGLAVRVTNLVAPPLGFEYAVHLAFAASALGDLDPVALSAGTGHAHGTLSAQANPFVARDLLRVGSLVEVGGTEWSFETSDLGAPAGRLRGGLVAVEPALGAEVGRDEGGIVLLGQVGAAAAPHNLDGNETHDDHQH
jgi:hypothetical protein